MIKPTIKKTILFLAECRQGAFDILKRSGISPKLILVIPGAIRFPGWPALRYTHKGKRCFIMGKRVPVWKNPDLSKLKNEFTFGLNRIYSGNPGNEV